MALGLALGALAAGSGAIGLFSGLKAASSARKIGRLNVSLINEETDEDLRRFGRETEATLDMARAARGASGVSAQSGSFQTFMAEQQAEANKQMAFIRRAAETRKDLAREGASSASRTATIGGIQSFIGGAQSAAKSIFGGT